MRFKLNTNYSGEELRFLEEHSGGVYIAEIMDDETGSLVWAVLSKWKGIYHFSAYYASLDALERGM